jgi:hypothetical protein
MNKTTQEANHIEKALTMYKENVSPSETCFQAILSQIPEQQKLKEGRAIRSPYRWLAVTQMVTVFAVVMILLPVAPQKDQPDSNSLSLNPYYEIDKQIETFESSVVDEDATLALNDTTL